MAPTWVTAGRWHSQLADEATDLGVIRPPGRPSTRLRGVPPTEGALVVIAASYNVATPPTMRGASSNGRAPASWSSAAAGAGDQAETTLAHRALLPVTCAAASTRPGMLGPHRTVEERRLAGRCEPDRQIEIDGKLVHSVGRGRQDTHSRSCSTFGSGIASPPDGPASWRSPGSRRSTRAPAGRTTSANKWPCPYFERDRHRPRFAASARPRSSSGRAGPGATRSRRRSRRARSVVSVLEGWHWRFPRCHRGRRWVLTRLGEPSEKERYP